MTASRVLFLACVLAASFVAGALCARGGWL